MIKPTVKITLDRERSLCFDHDAFIAIEELTGKSVITHGIDTQAIMSAKGIRDFLWVALRHEDKEITQAEVSAMISFDRLPEIQEAVAKALIEAMPKPKPKAGKSANPPKASR